MNYYKLKLSYNGYDYFGWQIQNGSKLPTIQGSLNSALEKITNTAKIKSIGSGRTDAKVHALGQIVRIEIEKSIDPVDLKRALNSILPLDIRVITIERCEESFHPIASAVSKEYRYYFSFGEFLNPFQGKLISHCRAKHLDLKKMQEACRLLVGEHDFCNYFCRGTEVKSTIRRIDSCSIQSGSVLDSGMYSEHYYLKIEGNGFLKQMVRLIIGSLWEVGKGKLSLAEFKNSLETKQSQHLAAVAPPQGLYLYNVKY